jgi:putative endonuclease
MAIIGNRTGKLGEDIAAHYLKTKGFEILEQNHWKPYGEIDIVAIKQGRLHFVEVKAGRVISEKNRQTLQSAIEYMTQASGALQQLLDAAEAQGSEGKVHDGDGSSKQRSSDAGSDEEVFKQWLLMKQVLRAVNTATSDALSKSKLFIRSK